LSASFYDDLTAHDAAVDALGLEMWVGAEPTFTRRDSQEPPWLFVAEGGDKEARAEALLLALAPRLDGKVRLFRTVGRQYPEEDAPRFALGALWDRGARGRGERTVVDAAGLSERPVQAPPVGPDSAWLTVTPDPAVVEVNMAPAPSLSEFHAQVRAIWDAAAEVGLSPVRYRYDGQVSESGGGGQITLGASAPGTSPFFTRPQLLPGLLRLFNWHPSLSYLFSPECVGSASQGPRPDEGVRERFEELGVCLDRLALRGSSVTPDELWSSLAPLLVDGSGNSHRAELNVEKLWNPFLGDRGRMGVVEFRSLGMPARPEGMTARAALLRALAARVAAAPVTGPLVEWGSALHDRFALPSVLLDDLAAVLDDLEAHGLGIGPALAAELTRPVPPVARVVRGGATLTLSKAREFWPLFGDVASQERSGSRLVDSSGARLEALVEAPAGEPPGRLLAMGWEIPLVPFGPGRHIAGIRYRSFVPNPGFHPGLPAADPLRLRWERGTGALSIDLHGWIPGGGVYEGLPESAEEAARRRDRRVVVREEKAEPALHARFPARSTATGAGPDLGNGAFTVDLRRLPPAC
jgi:uncharacterized protein (DUF2126 family)